MLLLTSWLIVKRNPRRHSGFRALLSGTGFAIPQQDVDAVQFSGLLSTARLKKRRVPCGRHSRESGNPCCPDASPKMDSRFRGNDARVGLPQTYTEARKFFFVFTPTQPTTPPHPIPRDNRWRSTPSTNSRRWALPNPAFRLRRTRRAGR